MRTNLIAALLSFMLWTVISANLEAQDTNAAQQELGTLIQKAQTLIANNDFQGAQKHLTIATTKFPKRPGPWFMLGYSLHAQKKYGEALKAYEISRQSPQTKTTSLYNIACIYSIQGKKEAAFEMIDLAVQSGFDNFSQLQSDSDFANIKNDPRFVKLQPKWLDDEELFVESTRIIHKWSGETAGDQFGWTARRVGDLDDDGVVDFVATAPTFNNGSGKIYVYSGNTGKLLHAMVGKPGHRLGNSAVGVGDINGDGVPDIIAGAPNANGKGAAFVYSGSDASVIHSLTGQTRGGQFGYEVSEAGDVDGDDVPDFLIGEMSGNGKEPKSGKVAVYSGQSATLLFELDGEKQGDGFGNAAAISNYGTNESLLAIGAQNAGPGNRGRVYLYQIKDATPELQFTIEGDKNSVNLGQMFISFPGDVDQDGVPDVYASDFSDNTMAKGGGKVVIHSGANGDELLCIHGQQPGEGLGTSPSDAGDVDGDGIGDLVVGAWQNKEGAQSGGKVYLYSAANNGKLLRSWTCKQSGDTLGFDACGIGDVDGDGHIDFLLTSAWSNVNGAKSGRVFIVAGEEFAEPQAMPKPRDGKSPQKLTAGKVETVLDDLDSGTGGLNIDSENNLYSADFGSRLNGTGTKGKFVHKVSQTGEATLFCDQFQGASGNTFDFEGNLYQSNIGGGFVSKVSPDGVAAVFAKGFRNPVGLVFDKNKNLFVCNCGNNTISKVSPAGAVTAFCNSKLLNCPNGITIAADGTLYVCNFGNGDVIAIRSNGKASKLATLPGSNNGHLIFHEGFLYVIARKDCRVYQMDLAGRFEAFVGSGVRGKSDGPALQATLSLPNSLIASHDGKWLFINETSPTSGNHIILSPTRIRRVELNSD